MKLMATRNVGRRSRIKGSSFELRVSRILSAWWAEDESMLRARAVDLPLRRAPGSGGWDVRRGAGSDLLVMTPDFCFPFGVECKNTESWSFDGLFKGNGGASLLRYWEQCETATRLSSLCPLLVFTRNTYPVYALMPRQWAEFFDFDWTIHYRPLDVVVGFLDGLTTGKVPSKAAVQAEWSAIRVAT